MAIREFLNLPSPKEVYDLLIREPLKKYIYTEDHLRRVRVNKQNPRYFIGNDAAKVAYWRTKRSDGVRVETVAFFHTQKTGDVRITFLNGKFEMWTHGHTSGRPMGDSDLEYLYKILTLVRNFAP